MNAPIIEHINITVRDGAATAAKLNDLFGWHIRWEGEAMNGVGYTWHIGTETDYLALYSPKAAAGSSEANSYAEAGRMNHIGLVVDDLDAMERRVLAAGYKPHLHADYEPGRRFYFDTEDGIEFEIVSYG